MTQTLTILNAVGLVLMAFVAWSKLARGNEVGSCLASALLVSTVAVTLMGLAAWGVVGLW